MLVKIPFVDRYLAILEGCPPKLSDFDLNSETALSDFLDNLDKDYSTGVWTPDITEITSDIRFVMKAKNIN